MPTLFQPLDLGAIRLPNRIVMAPLTRCRAEAERIPNDLMRDYYVQRAAAGLIISEATSITPEGVGYPDTPGIWSDAQTAGWRRIVAAVHAAGGRMLLQLWHVGRVSHPSYLGGDLPVAPSAIAPEGHVSLVRPKSPFVVPRALETAELPRIVADYRAAAERAKAAGFDGVEIHGANGYLLDQFLQDSTNKRTDAYGGPIENRARLMLEVTDAVISVWGASRVGMHLAPRGDAHTMGDSNPAATFGYIATELGRRRIAFLCTREHEPANGAGGWLTPGLKRAFGGPVIGNEGFTAESASAAIAAGAVDAVAFGKAYIANPDLVHRFATKAALNAPDMATFYAAGPHGYTDYPELADA